MYPAGTHLSDYLTTFIIGSYTYIAYYYIYHNRFRIDSQKILLSQGPRACYNL